MRRGFTRAEPQVTEIMGLSQSLPDLVRNLETR